VEIFSLLPYAFGDRDILTVQSLARRVVEAMYGLAKAHQARALAEESLTLPGTSGEMPTLEGELDEPVPDVLSPPSSSELVVQEQKQEEQNKEEVAAPSVELPAFLSDPSPAVNPELPVLVPEKRDYVTGALTVAAIGVALVLGWVLGYARWKKNPSSNTVPSPLASSLTKSTAPAATTPAVTSPEIVFPSSPAIPQTTQPTPKEVSPGGLVVYEEGRVIFRLTPRAGSTSSGTEKTTPPANISPEVASSYVLHRVEPDYPETARERHVQGAVVLNVLVGVDGTVQELKVVSGEPLLTPAAADAVRQWRFRPYRRNRVPSEFETNVTVNFLLP
jgi:TonB family protein